MVPCQSNGRKKINQPGMAHFASDVEYNGCVALRHTVLLYSIQDGRHVGPGGTKQKLLVVNVSEIPSVLLPRPPAADVVSEWKAPVRRCPSP